MKEVNIARVTVLCIVILCLGQAISFCFTPMKLLIEVKDAAYKALELSRENSAQVEKMREHILESEEEK